MSRAQSEYTVACICPMGIEMAPVTAMLDEIHDPISTVRDQNAYILGEIGQHNIVMAVMPEIGNNAAAIVATQLINDFPAIRFALLVGIAGGVPGDEDDDEHDIRLGDVVVSNPSGTVGGVVQYDIGRWLTEGRFLRTGHLYKPPSVLRANVQLLRAQHEMKSSKMAVNLSEMMQRYPKMLSKYKSPDPEINPDQLFLTSYAHEAGNSCSKCDATKTEPRHARATREPHIHYGTIGSANAVVKDAVLREQLRQDMNLSCIEMEAAGLMDSFPCLVIRGICDYADSHKNKEWQPYAASVAAAYMKELLLQIPVQSVLATTNAKEVVVSDRETHQLLERGVQLQEQILGQAQERVKIQATQFQTEEEKRCHRVFKVTNYESQKDRNPLRLEGTCRWVLEHQLFKQWVRHMGGILLWISADPGCGKSVLAKSLVDQDLADHTGSITICYFFFKDVGGQNSLHIGLCTILHQLFSEQPHLLAYALGSYQNSGDKIQQEPQTPWRILLSAMASPSARPVICVLDALDECNDRDRRQLIEWLCDYQRQSVSAAPTLHKLKFLLTSRPLDSVQRWFERLPQNLPQIRLRGEDENDNIQQEIGFVIDRQVDELTAEFQLLGPAQQRLRQGLREMQHRTYLWLHISVEAIRDAFRNSLNPNDVEVANLLPKDVEDAYEGISRRVQPAQKLLVKQILLLVAGARRALSVPEMAVALKVHRQLSGSDASNVDEHHLEKHVRDWCRLFVFIKSSRVYLIHQTAKEFLVKKDLVDEPPYDNGIYEWKWSWSQSALDRHMARLRVEHLCSTLGHTTTAFSGYCAEHSLWHLEDDSIDQDRPFLEQVLSLYDAKGPAFHLWFYTMWSAYNVFAPIPQLSDEHLAAFRGHVHLLAAFQCRTDFDIEAKDGGGRTALHWAAARGHCHVVGFLLNHTANVHAVEDLGDTALHKASEGGSVNMEQLLLHADARVNTRSHLNTRLHRASSDGHTAVVERLLAQGAHVNQFNVMEWTALHVASSAGQTEIVQKLLAAGADVDARGRHGIKDTPLHRASRNGYADTIQTLLDYGAAIGFQDTYGETSLYKASKEGQAAAVLTLLENHADVRIRDRNGHEPFGRACCRGFIDVMQIFLDHGCNINARDNGGRTALGAARGANAATEVERWLLDRGAIE